MPSLEETLIKLAEELRPLKRVIDANLRELEDQQRRSQQAQRQRSIREDRYRLLVGELMGEAEAMMQRVAERVIHGAVQIETEYPTEGVHPRCVLQIEPTPDFPHPFCVVLRFPRDPDLEGEVEIQVACSAKITEPGQTVSSVRFTLDACEHDKLREWIYGSIAAATKRYFETRVERNAGA